MRGKAEPAATVPPAIISAPRLARTAASCRWAALVQQIVEVDPLACPTCRGPMRIVAFITQAAVLDEILTHLRTRAARPLRLAPTPRGDVRRAQRYHQRISSGRLRPVPPPGPRTGRPARRAGAAEDTPTARRCWCGWRRAVSSTDPDRNFHTVGGFMHPYITWPRPPAMAATILIALDVALGRGDFHDIGALWSDELASAAFYYRLLNAGFRLPATAGLPVPHRSCVGF